MLRIGQNRKPGPRRATMLAKRRWNERTRLMLTLELAVVLPATALIALSVLHLKSIQRDRQVEAAIQRDFSQVLAISEKHINYRAYELVDAVREEMPPSSLSCSSEMDRVLKAHPYVAHLFIYDPDQGLFFRSQPARLEEDDFREESNDLEKMIHGWMKSEYPVFSEKLEKLDKKGTPYYFSSNYPRRGDKHLYQTMGFFVQRNKSDGSRAIEGIVFDAEFLRDKFFPEVMTTVLTHSASETQGTASQAAIMMHMKGEATPIAASSGWDGGIPEVERNMDSVFPGMTLGMKLTGTTLEALGQRFIRSSFLILGGISLLLAGGIILTYRNVAKEVALARLKSDFVSNVSHELRTPLSLIRLYAETLEMGRLNNQEKYQEYYKIIRKESERLTSLINNILDFSRIEAGKKEYDFRDTDMAELVRNTLDSYRYQIEQHGFRFEEKIAEDLPAMRIDREAMARSLVNLVNNALKYSQERKYLGVNLYRENGSVKLEVVDHGIGIPTAEQHKIFEKFYRAGDPLVHNTKGSGLGLSLVRHIVHAHGGDVSVESTPGAGSKFTIALPVASAHVQQAASA
jgi:signal transduction histidine kinase